MKVLEGEAQIAEARHTLGSLEDQIADLTNSFNDLVGCRCQPTPNSSNLLRPDGSGRASAFAAPDPLPELRRSRSDGAQS